MDCVTLGQQSGTVSTNPLPRSDHVTRCDNRDVNQISAHVRISMRMFTANTKPKIYTYYVYYTIPMCNVPEVSTLGIAEDNSLIRAE